MLDAGGAAERIFVPRDKNLPPPKFKQSPVHVIARLKPIPPRDSWHEGREWEEEEEAMLLEGGLSCSETGVKVAVTAPTSLSQSDACH